MSNKPKTKSRLSVQEFQTWLQGIMEFQSPDWSPNAEQWNAIFDKIMNLKTEETTPTVNVSATSIKKLESSMEEILRESLRNFNNAPTAVQEHYVNNAPPRTSAPSPGLFDEPDPAPPPQAPGGITPGQELISAEEFEQLSPEELDAKLKAAKEGLNTSSGLKPQHKTPSIDSSQGYKSGFL